jgi:complement component 1 Q subcomponent-binding protein
MKGKIVQIFSFQLHLLIGREFRWLHKAGFIEQNIKLTSNVFILGDIELAAKLEDELKHEKASGLEDLETSVQNIQYVLQNNSWEVSIRTTTIMDFDTNLRIVHRLRMFLVNRKLC